MANSIFPPHICLIPIIILILILELLLDIYIYLLLFKDYYLTSYIFLQVLYTHN